MPAAGGQDPLWARISRIYCRWPKIRAPTRADTVVEVSGRGNSDHWRIVGRDRLVDRSIGCSMEDVGNEVRH